MAQPKVLLAFRARLRSRGYHDIKIMRNIDFDGCQVYDRFGFPEYLVRCVEPLCGYTMQFIASEPQMANWPGIEFYVYCIAKQDSLDLEEEGILV